MISLNEKQNEAPIAHKILSNEIFIRFNNFNSIDITLVNVLLKLEHFLTEYYFFIFGYQIMKNIMNMIFIFYLFCLSNIAVSDDILKGFDAYQDKNYQLALEIWKPLAEKGDPIAQNSLGVMFQRGQGVKKNYNISLNWFKKSAEQGYTPAQVSLGYIYDQGMGAPVDKVSAFMWWEIASSIGDSDAKTLLQILSTEIDENDKVLALEKAKICFRNKYKEC